MAAIKIENLTKYYGKSRGIEGVNLTVDEGEFYGFIGPNGAGKSTTIRTLLGLISPTEGNASIFGMDITKDKTEILKQIGYLPSETIFYSGMKVNEVLKLSADLRKLDCSDAAAELCRRLQLDVTRKVSELSFGNRKKVGIVCALQHNPKLLILDEPTSGLDPLMQKEFFEILKERNEAGTTIFLSSHVLSEIQKNCSRAAIIREGKIIAEGSVEELSNTSAKRVIIEGDVDLDGLEGVRNMTVNRDNAADDSRASSDTSNCKDSRNVISDTQTVSFLYSGEMSELLRRLAAGKVKDISITEPDLEEIFMHYYEKEGK